MSINRKKNFNATQKFYKSTSIEGTKKDKVSDNMWKSLYSRLWGDSSSFSHQLTCLTSSFNKASANSQADKASMQHMSILCFRSSLMSRWLVRRWSYWPVCPSIITIRMKGCEEARGLGATRVRWPQGAALTIWTSPASQL